jgi:flagellar basal-body rod protein FlgF
MAVQMPDGSEAYTRNGSFELNVNGLVQTRNGLSVQGDGGPVTIPPDVKISVGVDGTISVLPESGAQNTVSVVGRFKLVNPPQADLVRGEDGLFRLRDGSAAPTDESIKIAPGTLEGSNVNPAEQMVTMISLARQFEMQMKMLSMADANDRSATQLMTAL